MLHVMALLAVGVLGTAAWHYLRRGRAAQLTKKGGAHRLPRTGGGADLAAVCAASSAALDAHVAVLAPNAGDLKVLAGAPTRPHLQLFDRMAADWALSHCIPTGRGTGLVASSDWQFQPIFSDNVLVALAAIAGKRGREPVLPGQEWLLEDVLRRIGDVLSPPAAERCGAGVWEGDRQAC